MAFNQASFFLFPPGFAPVVEYDHTETAASGKPLAIINAELVDPSANLALTVDLRSWFFARGFAKKERYGGLQILFRGRTESFLGVQELINVRLPLDEAGIDELGLRFLLTAQTPAEIPICRDLVAELGHDFGFQILDDSHRLLPCIDFLTVLRENWNFKVFQKNFGWRL